MGIQLIWWPGGEVLEYTCTGAVEGPDLVSANREALDDPRFPGLRYQLCDMEQVSTFEVGADDIRRIVSIDQEAARRAPGIERVAIACAGDLIYGFARMYELTLGGTAPGWETGVFRTRAEATSWLGLDEDGQVPATPDSGAAADYS